jgi:hypothetical protein
MRSAILHGAAALATFAFVLTSAPDAGAATVLTTAPAVTNNGQTPTCLITNIDKKPITVTAQLFDPLFGNPETPVSNTCPVPPATLAPGTGCFVMGGANTNVYVVVTTSSAKVRAALDVFDGTTGALEVHIPATK